MKTKNQDLSLHKYIWLYGLTAVDIVIKIFGIYTHVQMDRCFWDQVSHELSWQKNDEQRWSSSITLTNIMSFTELMLVRYVSQSLSDHTGGGFVSKREVKILAPSYIQDLHEKDLVKVFRLYFPFSHPD